MLMCRSLWRLERTARGHCRGPTCLSRRRQGLLRAVAGLPYSKFSLIHTLADAVCRYGQAGPISIDGFLAGEIRMPAGKAEASGRLGQYLRLFRHGSLSRPAVLEQKKSRTHRVRRDFFACQAILSVVAIRADWWQLSAGQICRDTGFRSYYVRQRTDPFDAGLNGFPILQKA